jgi:hypothetical protein
MWLRGARRSGPFALAEYNVDEGGPREKSAAAFTGGEMSLVGPRPIADSEWKLHYPDALQLLEFFAAPHKN